VDDTSAANPVFNAYTKSSGLSSVSIDALAEDLAGRIYAASEGIIDRLDPDTGRIRAFTTADGVLSGTMWAAFRDGTGALWFGGDQGLCTIQPRADRTDPPAVLIHGIKVNGENWRISDLGEAEPGWLVIRMQDDGAGIASEGRSTNGGHGLTNMQSRAARVGGTLEMTSVPGQGVTSVLRVPLMHRPASRRVPWLRLR
jgi:hypothetical protein